MSRWGHVPVRWACSCFQLGMSRLGLSSVCPRLGPCLSSGCAAIGTHRGQGCLLLCVDPTRAESSAPCAIVQDGTPAAVCLSTCGESPVDILGSFLQPAAKADACCLCSNWVKKIRGTACVKEKPECSLHLHIALVF